MKIVCRDDEVRRFVDVIKKHGYTGERGDGRVFVLQVELAANIRTGEDGANSRLICQCLKAYYIINVIR